MTKKPLIRSRQRVRFSWEWALTLLGGSVGTLAAIFAGSDPDIVALRGAMAAVSGLGLGIIMRLAHPQ